MTKGRVTGEILYPKYLEMYAIYNFTIESAHSLRVTKQNLNSFCRGTLEKFHLKVQWAKKVNSHCHMTKDDFS